MTNDMTQLFEQAADTEQLPTPTTESLDGIRRLAQRQYLLEQEIIKIAAHGKELVKKLEQVSRIDLPEAMKSIGLTDFTMESGHAISVEDVLKASIPSGAKDPEVYAKALQAYAWLEAHNAGSIVKQQIVLTFGKSDHDQEQLEKTKKLLEENKLDANVNKSVHQATLTKHVKELKEKGKPYDEKLLGVFEWTEAKIKPPKKKKQKKK